MLAVVLPDALIHLRIVPFVDVFSQDVLVVEIRLQGNSFEDVLKLIEHYLFPVELVHVPLGFNDEPLELILLDRPVFFVLPQPLDMGGRQQLQHQPGFFGVGLGIDDYFVRRHVQVEVVVLPQKVVLLQPGLELAPRVVNRHAI